MDPNQEDLNRELERAFVSLPENYFREFGLSEEIESLLHQGARFSDKKNTLLQDFFCNSEIQKAEYLIKFYGASVSDAPRGIGYVIRTVLQNACHDGIKLLLRNSVRFEDVKDGLSYQLQEQIEFWDTLQTAKLIIDLGGSVHDVPMGLGALLQSVFSKNRLKQVEFLLQEGASFSSATTSFETLLRRILVTRTVAMEDDGIVNTRPQNGIMPTELDMLVKDCFENQCHNLVKVILQHCVSLSDLPININTLLQNQYYERDYKAIEMLLEHGASFSKVPCGPIKILSDVMEDSDENIRFISNWMSVESFVEVVCKISHCKKFEDIVDFPSKSIFYLKQKCLDSNEEPTTFTCSDGLTITGSATMLRARSEFFQMLLHSVWEDAPTKTFKVGWPLKTMEFLIEYAEKEPFKVDWSPFAGSIDRTTSDRNLGFLLDILEAAHEALMRDLFLMLEKEICMQSDFFIRLDNAAWIKEIAVTLEAQSLIRCCEYEILS